MYFMQVRLVQPFTEPCAAWSFACVHISWLSDISILVNLDGGNEELGAHSLLLHLKCCCKYQATMYSMYDICHIHMQLNGTCTCISFVWEGMNKCYMFAQRSTCTCTLLWSRTYEHTHMTINTGTVAFLYFKNVHVGFPLYMCSLCVSHKYAVSNIQKYSGLSIHDRLTSDKTVNHGKAE